MFGYFSRLEKRLWYIQRRLLVMDKRLRRMGRRMREMEGNQMATWNEVLDSVTRQETVTESVLTFIAGLKDEMAVLAAKPSGPTQEEMQEVVARLEADANKVAEAIAVNTDAEGEDIPVEEPVAEEPVAETPVTE